jgi:hypothetical protein
MLGSQGVCIDESECEVIGAYAVRDMVTQGNDDDTER